MTLSAKRLGERCGLTAEETNMIFDRWLSLRLTSRWWEHNRIYRSLPDQRRLTVIQVEFINGSRVTVGYKD